MNLKKNKKFIIVVCALSILFTVACEAASKMMDSALDNKLVKDQVGGETVNNLKAGKEIGGNLAEAAKAAISSMPLEDERVLGETVGVQLYATQGFGEPVKNQDLMLFLNTMANVIAQNSARPNIPYHVAVVTSDEKNAYALPGGYIFLTSGLVLSLQNEAQLAVVIGHEIAHIAKKHTLNEMQKSKSLGSLVDAGGGALKASSFGSDSQMGVFTDFIKDLGKKIAAHSFSKELEIEADMEGVRYAYDTGYDPKAILGVLDILQAKDADVSGDHATTSDRRAAFQQKLQNEFAEEGMSGLVTTTGRMQQVKQWIQSGNAGW
ncbi:M48 family metalloprotease [Candidatus Uabimicrobium sp. HlEnr_7]|uniref:M48 family metalloprotease n=1 Tax=Candidatus Uabimicrobium helgolandensis TaxID=3095367 RepID=UPI0035569710